MATKRKAESRGPIADWRGSRKAWGQAVARLASWRRLDDDDRDRLGASIRLLVLQAAQSLRRGAEALLPLARETYERSVLRRLTQTLPLYVTRLTTTDGGDPLSFEPLESVDAVLPDLNQRWEAEGKRTDAPGGLNDERMKLLGRLVDAHPNSIKMADLLRSDLPQRLRADRTLRKELAALRNMNPPLACKGNAGGYHAATPEGVRAYRRRGGRKGAGR